MNWEFKNPSDSQIFVHKISEETKRLVSPIIENLIDFPYCDTSLIIDEDTNQCGAPNTHKGITCKYSIEIGCVYLCSLKRNCCFVTSVFDKPEITNELFKYAVASVLFHEIGHILHNEESNVVLEQEKVADEYEFNEIIKIGDINAITGTLISLYSIMEIDLLSGNDSNNEYDNHPSTLSRIEFFLSKCRDMHEE